MRRQFLIFSLLSAFLTILPAHADEQTAKSITMLRTRAVEAQFAGDTDAALSSYQQALDLARGAYGADSPFLAEIYFDMGSLCLNVSRFPKAEEYLSQTVKLSPNSTAAHIRLAELKRLQGRPEEAARHAALILSKHGDDIAARQELALDYERNDDAIRAYHELSTLEQIIQRNKAVYEGRNPGTFPGLSFAPAQIKLNVAPKLTNPPTASVDAAKAKAKADADRKKAEEEKRKQAENAEKLAAQEKKKAQQKADADKKKTLAKAEAERKKALAKAAEAKKKAQPKPASPAVAASSGEVVPSTGLKANLTSKAVLLTPVKKKPPTPAPAPVNNSIEPDESIDEGPKTPPPKKAEPKKAEPKAPAAPKPGKHAPGLVPPPPPIIGFPSMMAPPPPVQSAPKPKAAAPKKEEKPKEAAPAKEDKPEPDDDFLLDWGGAGKKKK